MFEIFLLTLSAAYLRPAAFPFECTACQDSVSLLRRAFESGVFLTIGSAVATDICSLAVKRSQCEGLVTLYASIIQENFAKGILDPEYLCYKMQACSSPQYLNANLTQYKQEVLKDMPKISPRPQPGAKTFKFLHISDIHVDHLYTPTGNPVCDDIMCCRVETDIDPAPYGRLAHCDVPVTTFELALKQMSQMDFDFAIWTGDNLPHDIWSYQPGQSQNQTALLTNLFKKYIDKPIYPVPGNHDCFPMDEFKVFEQQTLVNDIADLWQDWMTEEQSAQFRQNWSYVVKNPKTGINVMAINTQMYDMMNFYIWQNSTDYGNLLQWMREELYQLENKGEKTIVIGHIPMGDIFSDSDWTRRHRILTTRFQETISAHMFAHTHEDQFYLVNSELDGQDDPANVVYAVPSFTTWTNHNPQFRIYEMDYDTYQVVNYYQYRLDLEKANLPNSTPEFELNYNPKDLYGMKDLSPSSWKNLSQQLATNSTLQQIYDVNFEGQFPNKAKVCDAKCAKNNYCMTSSTVFDEIYKCTDFNFQNLIFQVLEKAQDPWTIKK